MGGDSQPQIMVQLLARILAAGTPAGEAVDAPRWTLGEGRFGTWTGDGPERVKLEDRAGERWAEGLEARGHTVSVSTVAPDHRFGHANVVTVDDGMLEGGADPRALIGAAVGY
jgi:gamma-glutamyltranspeptidase/glutathione hydrolase